MTSNTIDEMHCVFQEVVKMLMGFWFDIDHRRHPSSLFTFINIVDEKIQELKPPSYVNRMPRKVSDFYYWKAT